MKKDKKIKFTPSGLPKKNYRYIHENARHFEEWIRKAIDKKCYIEAIILIHNTIELYLRGKIIEYLIKTEKKERLDEEKYEILFGRGYKNIYEYTEIAYLFNIISLGQYKKLMKFNTKRNDVVHGFLKKKIKYEYLKNYCKQGREIQLRLSPHSWSKEQIKKGLKPFE